MRTVCLAATAALLISSAGGAFSAETSPRGGTTEGKAATAGGSGQNQAAPSSEAKTTVTVQPGGAPAGSPAASPSASPAGTTAGAAGEQVTRGGCGTPAAGRGADRSGEVGQPVPPPGC